MSKYKTKPISTDDLKTYPLRSRRSKVKIGDFARTFSAKEPFVRFIQSLPNTLAAKDFKDFLILLRKARQRKRAIVFALGAHVIKVGLNPLFIDLMKKGWISALALNGAGIIHDFELAFAGHTSEDVGVRIRDGRFGMAKETGELLNEAIRSCLKENIGLGEAVGSMIAHSDFAYKNFSITAAAYDLDIPVTVHVAIGTDTFHLHPGVDGEALGRASLRDFLLICSILQELEGGGVFINVGSAVILPEVFLKGVAAIRNMGSTLEDFSTAVFDFSHHYRPYHNVVKRPLGKKGRGFYFIGHHEIMIPLLAASLNSQDM
jgi:hypothetical protein